MRDRSPSLEMEARVRPAAISVAADRATSVAKFPIRWEFMSIIVWDDDSKSAVTSDIEDVEVLNSLGGAGWELVCVVPLARTQVLEMAYPGNTRKLLGYLKRPVL
ncbi:MAG: hypothetical protein ACYC5Q_02830 [Thermoleophilia bacterium]